MHSHWYFNESSHKAAAKHIFLVAIKGSGLRSWLVVRHFDDYSFSFYALEQSWDLQVTESFPNSLANVQFRSNGWNLANYGCFNKKVKHIIIHKGFWHE